MCRESLCREAFATNLGPALCPGQCHDRLRHKQDERNMTVMPPSVIFAVSALR
jgi:hypothetical protein